jgi:hypothetical protein
LNTVISVFPSLLYVFREVNNKHITPSSLFTAFCTHNFRSLLRKHIVPFFSDAVFEIRVNQASLLSSIFQLQVTWLFQHFLFVWFYNNFLTAIFWGILYTVQFNSKINIHVFIVFYFLPLWVWKWVLCEHIFLDHTDKMRDIHPTVFRSLYCIFICL